MANPQENPASIVTKNPLTGRQEYAANMKGGVKLVSGQVIYQNLFGLSTSSDDAYAKVLTNMDQAGKMNDSEGFLAYQYGVRVVKLSDGPATPEQAAAVLKFLSSCRLQLFIGPNSVRVLDIETIHFLNTQSVIINDTDAAATPVAVAIAASLPQNSSAWFSLPNDMKQEFKQNMNFKASLECELSGGTPSALGAVNDVPQFAFIFIIAGRRVVIGG